MSGGSYDYLYIKVQMAAEDIANQKSSLRRAFGDHLKLVAAALHDIEWVDSSDYGLGDEIAAIKKVLGTNAKPAQISLLKEDARKLISELQSLL